MDPVRWRRVEEIYQAASERKPEERAAFLATACDGDEDLRREVESLVVHGENAERFLQVPSPVKQPEVGQRISHYEIQEKLGEGGMGAVYRALDTMLVRPVALKFLNAESDIDEEARAALINEARASSALDHPNIGTIYGIEAAPDGRQFIVMACYEGQTLARKLKNGPLPAGEGAAVALQAAGGLGEAHAHHIIHRDIKPSNIFLTRQGLVKILDFGLARAVRPATSTLSVNIPGTAAYMSPEQAQGRYLDTRTDLWSLGAVIYEIATGRRAFAAGSVPATLFAIVHEPPPAMGDEVPRALQKVIYRALAKLPEDRYQSAAEMILDLRQFSGTDVPGCDPTITLEEVSGYRKLAAGRPPSRTWRRYLRWRFAPTLAIVLAAAFLTLRHPAGPKAAAYEFYLKAVPYLQRHERLENLDRGISLLNAAVKADAAFALAFASLGDAYRLKARLTQDPSLLAKAESNARRALELNDGLAQVHVVMGGVQSALGNRDLAQAEYQKARALDPSNAEALTGLAREYTARQRIPEAEGLYRKAAALRPESWEGYNNLGIFLKEQKQPEEAAVQFRRVIQLAPDNVAGYANLAAALIDAGKLEGAEAPLRRAVQLDPSSYVVLLNLGQLNRKRRLFPEAEAAIRQSLSLNDKYWIAWESLAVVERWLNRDQEAVAAYQRAIPLVEEAVRVQPKQAALRATLAEIYAYCRMNDKSLSEIEAALALDPESADVLLSCADAYAALGNRGLAVATANKAVANGLSLATLDRDPEARRFRTDPDFKSPSK